MTLKAAIANILSREVTEEEAKNFALEQYETLYAYIKNEIYEKKNSQCITVQVEEEYQIWLINNRNQNSESIQDVDILYKRN